MKKLIALTALAAFAVGGSPAFAADHPQQTRMKDCNVKAKGKKGDERRQFMSACLSTKNAPGKDVAGKNAPGKDGGSKDVAAKAPAKDNAVTKVALQKKPQ